MVKFVSIKTNPGWSKFSLQRFAPEPFELSEPGYKAEAYGHSDWKTRNVAICYRTSEADPKSVRSPVAITSVSGRKPADPARAIDFWTNPSEHHIVSEAARAFIEARDPGIHKFYPVELVHKESGERFGEANYFYWIIGRAVLTKRAAKPLGAEGYGDPGDHVAAGPAMGGFYATLAQDGAALERLAASPFWCFAPLDTIHMNTETHGAALDAGLTGLELTDRAKRIVRHAERFTLVAQGGSGGGWFKRLTGRN